MRSNSEEEEERRRVRGIKKNENIKTQILITTRKYMDRTNTHNNRTRKHENETNKIEDLDKQIYQTQYQQTQEISA